MKYISGSLEGFVKNATIMTCLRSVSNSGDRAFYFLISFIEDSGIELCGKNQEV